MANYTGYIKRYFNVDFPTIYDAWFGKKDPDAFAVNGSQIYYGYQGEGKTYSMVFHATKLKVKYPKSILVTNLHMNNLTSVKLPEGFLADPSAACSAILSSDFDWSKFYIRFETYEELITLLRYVRNGKFGVIFMIDEIHNYFHSHDSKSMPMWVVQVFSQQRKQRLVVLGSVQDWDDLIKAIRRQIDNLIQCTRVGHLVFQTAVDPRDFENNFGEREAPIRKRGMVWLSSKVYDLFDTYQVINSGREILGGSDLNVKTSVIGEISKTRKR